MSSPEEMQQTQTPQRNKKRQRKSALILLTLLFIIIGVGWGAYWYLVLRHYESTDNAYVAGNQVQIQSQVSGSVMTVNVDNTDFVTSGTVLVELDPRDAELALDKAKTELANSVRQTRQHMVNSRQLQANIEVKRSELNRLQNDLKRREVLGSSHVIGKEELQHAREAVVSAKAALDMAIEQYNANQAIVLNSSIEKQPAVEQAATQVRNAWLTLQRTKIVSPVDGYVSRRSVQVGSQITPSTPLMAIVPSNGMWIDANFKETQLADMRIGQPAKVITDFYGKDIVFNGTVVGLDMGTGSAFSLLPAQNASGNWIKVVQRLPVRIALNENQLEEHPLRIGLSTEVTVDTLDKNGKVLSKGMRDTPAYHTAALAVDMSPADKIVTEIINNNLGNK
ncbi:MULTISPECIES: multidrug efflux MFS transporter periplasmic adaptor subunit EmrA [Providencia]|uniref:Multidrug efflux MFS transporter periplasmic adaptor subunit EmrA n=1 Tax=Providencia hangzhouensis TaxID=3031799 RepID=A0ABY9Z6J1_9GAMM|nr:MULTISPECIES: multidrug efflux MFS transporter periplasmic adaptor subunit EmrA [Providencia]MBG5929113.1 multidrug efflux MFS transporter periplasmic adaptor subunit EmrA [Providencia rettgeri]MBQ0532251.1 multidrug efflux MFS transporter periplasmic adaptor subunit EmrA [Providencia rettgeri]MDH2376931.1 multidrug efflux MFS transporter periplasmic adaptor subunit EmrA [Providencia rettgeri]QLI98312.1 multidrug efflux MFS transporter periplasmic adaptor subunit EmrA [Providencia rettgeri]